MRAWADVASLTKAKSLKGRFVARKAADLPFVPEAGSEVAFVPPREDAPRRALVSKVCPIDENRYEIWFEEIAENEAELLVGCHILVKRQDIGEDFYADEPASWHGWLVKDESGRELGLVSAHRENPGQDLLEVERADGAGALLVPLAAELLLDVSVAETAITMKIPDGLLDL